MMIVLLTGILPLYEYIPDIDDIIHTQKTNIINKGAQEGILIIKNRLGTKELPLQDLVTIDLDLSEKMQIIFTFIS